MSPAERATALTNRPPEARDRMLAKVREYQALDPGRTRAAAARHGTALVSAAAAAHAAGGARCPAGAGAGRFARTGQVAARRNGAFCRRHCRRNFWPMSARCIISPRGSRSDQTLSAATAATAENHGPVQPVFRAHAGGKTADAQHAVRRRARPDGKNFAVVSKSCRRSSAHQCIRNYAKFAGMTRGRTRGVFEKRRKLVENVARRTPGLARPRGASAASGRRCRRRCCCRPCRSAASPPQLPAIRRTTWRRIKLEPASFRFQFRPANG